MYEIDKAQTTSHSAQYYSIKQRLHYDSS